MESSMMVWFCPKCGRQLEEQRRDDVVVDRCRFCDGMWLDRNELELLIAAARRARKA